MNVLIQPHKLAGTVTPPPSKSQTHRAALASALAGGGTLSNMGDSQDVRATRRCAAALTEHGGGLPALDCGESGSTLRFLIPLALVLRGGGQFTGHGRLMERPQQPYFDIFEEKGVFYERKDGRLTVRGTLRPGVYRLPGNVSSQFVTGLLYALPLLAGDSVLEITSPMESRGYVDMTLDVLEKFGIRIEHRDHRRFTISGGQSYRACDMTVEADWSQAGFWYAAMSLGNPVDVAGLDPRSPQGDRAIADRFAELRRPGDMDVDVSGIPDLVPPLAVMAAVRGGATRLTNAARLRLKESDRLKTTAAMVNAMGGRAEEGPDFLTVRGVPKLTGGVVDGANDHRIVMAVAIAATACQSPVTITGAEAVNKSYPTFWEEYKRLGGELHVL